MSSVGFKGIDVRQTGSTILFRVFTQTSGGALEITGPVTLKIYEFQSDGTLKSYDFSTNTFVTTTLTTVTASMVYQLGNNGATNTGVWTYALTTLTGFTAGSIYMALVHDVGASPTDQAREFQYGSAQGDLLTLGTTGASAGNVSPLLSSSPFIWLPSQATVANTGSSATTIKLTCSSFRANPGQLIYVNGTGGDQFRTIMSVSSTTNPVITVDRPWEASGVPDNTWTFKGVFPGNNTGLDASLNGTWAKLTDLVPLTTVVNGIWQAPLASGTFTTSGSVGLALNTVLTNIETDNVGSVTHGLADFQRLIWAAVSGVNSGPPQGTVGVVTVKGMNGTTRIVGPADLNGYLTGITTLVGT